MEPRRNTAAGSRSTPCRVKLVLHLVFNGQAGGTSSLPVAASNRPRKDSEACGEWRAHARPRAQANSGAVAQLGERLICTQEVVGSTPISSTSVGRQARRPRGQTPAAPAAGAGL